MGDTIGSRLKDARERRVMSQSELAALTGMPVTSISRIENDRYAARPYQRTIRKLADALGVEPSWLLTGDDGVNRGELKRAAV